MIVNETNTQFIEHIIFIMKNVLEAKYENEPPENLGHTSIEQLMLDIVRYVRHLVQLPLSLSNNISVFSGHVYSTAVEHTPLNPEVVDSISAGCCAFFFFPFLHKISIVLNQVPQGYKQLTYLYGVKQA